MQSHVGAYAKVPQLREVDGLLAENSHRLTGRCTSRETYQWERGAGIRSPPVRDAHPAGASRSASHLLPAPLCTAKQVARKHWGLRVRAEPCRGREVIGETGFELATARPPA
jgi:hypothetical protein